MSRTGSIGVTGALLAALAMTLAPSTADAQRWRRDGPPPGAYERGRGDGYYRRGDGYYRRGPDGDPRRDYRGRRSQRCRSDGTTGTILGAIAGGLLGDSVAGRGDRTTGAIVGGGVGALAGRAIDRDC
jgi:hypothetical protein